MTSLSLHLWLFAEAVLAFLLFSSSFNWSPSLHTVPLNLTRRESAADPVYGDMFFWTTRLCGLAWSHSLICFLVWVDEKKPAGLQRSHLHLSISLCHVCVSVFTAEMGPVVVVGGTAEAADFRQRCPLVCFPVCLSSWLTVVHSNCLPWCIQVLKPVRPELF